MGESKPKFVLKASAKSEATITPWEHQLTALDYCRKFQHPFLAMEMRLGKQLVTIWHLRSKLGSFPMVLIVAPKSTFKDWARDLNREKIPFIIVENAAQVEAARALGLGGWFLVNSERLLHHPAVAAMSWEGVVLDESPVIKNPKSLVSQLFCRNFRDAKVRMCLSGLPNPEGEHEWFQQMKFLHGRFMNHDNFWAWRNEHFTKVRYDWVAKPGSYERIKFAVNGRILRMTKKSCGLGNKRIYERRYVELPPDVAKGYKALEKDFQASIRGNEFITSWSTVKALRLQQIAGGVFASSDHKLKELLSLLKGELRKEPVVVWFRYLAEIDAAEKLLRENYVTVAKITGEESVGQRVQNRTLFDEAYVRVLLIQERTGRFGMDLSKASTEIFFSNEPGNEARQQATERIENLSKNVPLLTIDLVTKDTVDEDYLEALMAKKSDSKSFYMRVSEAFKRRVQIAQDRGIRTGGKSLRIDSNLSGAHGLDGNSPGNEPARTEEMS